jgi:hypothetical protein
MNAKREIIAAVVRIIANETNLIRKPTAFEAMLSEFFGEETYDRQIARTIEEESKRVVDAAKRVRTNRKFKKITSNM